MFFTHCGNNNVSNEPFFRFLPTVMMLVFVVEDGASVSLVFFRSRSSNTVHSGRKSPKMSQIEFFNFGIFHQLLSF